jgi:undecaprenyl diphosphate synthase
MSTKSDVFRQKTWDKIGILSPGIATFNNHGIEYRIKRKPRILDRKSICFSDVSSNLSVPLLSKQGKNNGTLHHLALIPDGNRRWAEETGSNAIQGYKNACDGLISLLEKAFAEGVHTVTTWAMSPDNFNRSEKEVGGILDPLLLLIHRRLLPFCHEHKARFTHLGSKKRLPAEFLDILRRAERETAGYGEHGYNMALDYGGREEVLDAINKYLAENPAATHVSEEDFAKLLYTGELKYPEPDLIVRTGTELTHPTVRTSGFMIWQGKFSEYYFTPKLYPEFKPSDLAEAIDAFYSSDRRFGK